MEEKVTRDWRCEASVNEFIDEVMLRVRSMYEKDGVLAPVAFIMSTQFPLKPAVLPLSGATHPSLFGEIVRSAVARYDAYGVLVTLEADRRIRDDPDSRTHVILVQLDHKYIGGRLWHAEVEDRKVGDLERLPQAIDGFFTNLIPADQKAN